jgi:hypothetical protein
MAIIVIKDLSDSVDLDRQAMAAIIGGGRISARRTSFGREMSAGSRILNYPGGLAHASRRDTDSRFSGTAPLK